jgi:hypothetical protein
MSLQQQQQQQQVPLKHAGTSLMLMKGLAVVQRHQQLQFPALCPALC